MQIKRKLIKKRASIHLTAYKGGRLLLVRLSYFFGVAVVSLLKKS